MDEDLDESVLKASEAPEDLRGAERRGPKVP